MSKIEQQLKEQIKEYYRLKKEEEEAKKKYKVLSESITGLFIRSGKKNIEVEGIIIEFVGSTTGQSIKYKEAFTQALTKVNTATARVLLEILKENTVITNVSAQIKRAKGSGKESVIQEGIFDNISGKVEAWFNKMLNKLKGLFSEKEKAQTDFIKFYSNLSDIMTKEQKIKYRVAESAKPQIKLSKLIEVIEKQTNKKLILKEFITVNSKDWERMSDLKLNNNNNTGAIADKINNKDKAIARFVAGLKISGEDINYNSNTKEFHNRWDSFGNKALQLGATVDEIKDVFNKTKVPDEILDKINKLSDKKLDNKFVGYFSKKLLSAGYDITFIKTNGNALTSTGRDAMRSNGRKWTIGYKTEITVNGKKFDLSFDAITDEGNGPSLYVVDLKNSNNIFKQHSETGILRFTDSIIKSLSKVK